MSFPFGSIPFPIDPDDPEIKAALLRQKQAAEDAEIESLEFKEDFAKWLKNATKDELQLFSTIFASLVRSPDMVKLYYGVINGACTIRYDTCPMCGDEHAKELHQGIEDELKKAAAEDQPSLVDIKSLKEYVEKERVRGMPGMGQLTFAEQRVIDFDFDPNDVSNEELEVIRSLANVPPQTPLSDDIQKRADEWKLDDAWDDSTPGRKIFRGWICLRCHIHFFPSIQDRMLTANDVTGCPGCLEKTKWG